MNDIPVVKETHGGGNLVRSGQDDVQLGRRLEAGAGPEPSLVHGFLLKPQTQNHMLRPYLCQRHAHTFIRRPDAERMIPPW